MLFATVRQRKIYVKAPQTVVKDGVNVDVLKLEMDDEWAEMTSIICVFSNGSVKKEVMHTFGQPITVPWECLESTGVLMLGITGYVGTQKVMTTMNADNGWEIVQNSETTGDEQFEATPTLTQQLLEAATSANNAAEAANTAKQDILDAVSNGEFDGAPGKDGADGKTAYQYAQDGGYTGTEAEFAEKMAEEIPAIDNSLSKSGQAADAAKVGEEIRSLSGKIENLGSGGSASVGSRGITDINIKKWFGKKIVIDGSSITAGGTGNTVPVWGSFLKDMFALAACYNHAVSGTGWFFSGDSYVVDRVDDYEADADAVILMGDYNGIYAYTSNPGTIDDAPAADGSYYAKLKYLAEKLIAKYPLCPVIWVVEPPRGAQGDGKTPMDYDSGYALQSKCIEEVADYYGFTHCNLMKSTVFRPWNETNYAETTSDGTHPWNNIQRTMAQVIAETMKRTPLIYNESYVNTPDDSSGGTTEDDSNKTVTALEVTVNGEIFESDTLEAVRNYLTVKATYSDLSVAVVTNYELSGTLVAGTSPLTVSYGGVTATVDVTVIKGQRTITINANTLTPTLGYLNGTGITSSTSQYYTADYLAVVGGTDITFAVVNNGPKSWYVYYDSEKTYLGHVKGVYGTKTYTLPDTAVYIRFNIGTDPDAQTIIYVPA